MTGRPILEDHLYRTAARFFARGLLGLALAIGLLWPGPVVAETGRWSQPRQLSGDIGGWFPDVTADDLGNVYVVWNGNLRGASKGNASLDAGGQAFSLAPGASRPTQLMSSALYYTRWDGLTWTDPNDIVLGWWGYALRSSIAVDRTGRLHLIHKGLKALTSEALGPKGSSGREDLWYTTANGDQAQSVTSWQPSERISQNTVGYFSAIAIDSHGAIHVIWTEYAQNRWGLYYAHSTDGGATWSRRVPLDESGPVFYARAHLKVDAQDRLHAIWETTDPNLLAQGNWYAIREAVYALSKDGGKTWSQQTLTSSLPSHPPDSLRGVSPGPAPQQPAVGIDGKGTILLVFREPVRDQILYSQSTDGVHWSMPALIPGVASGVPRPFDVYDTATDSAGHVHLVVVGYPDGSDSMSLLHCEWDEQRWGQPEVIAGSPPFPEYPRIAVGEGNRLHVVWFGGDDPSTARAAVGIWYSTAQTTAPRVVGQPQPVPQSQPEVAATPDAPPAFMVLPEGAKPSEAESGAKPIADRAIGASQRPGALRRNPSYPLAVGVVPVFLLLTAALCIKLGR